MWDARLGRGWARVSEKLPRRLRYEVWSRTHPPSKFVLRHLDGMWGAEIGAAAHADYGLRAINIDRYAEPDTVYKTVEEQACGRKRPIDLIANGDELPLRDDTVEFVFSSHVIEHIPDPLAALEEWCRVARHRVVLVVPHRDRTFDAGRELTPLSELLERHALGLKSEEDKHWTVWTRESFVEMCDATGFPVIDSLDPDDKKGDGFMVVIDASARRR
jgi:SAM-dependent methyltransferase